MYVALPDSLASFIAERVRIGGYPSPDAFVADLVGNEAGIMEGVARGEALPVDAHVDRRLAAMLDEADASDDYEVADSRDFDEMEREALATLETRGPRS